ncbi:MAG: hypothetical protein R6U55_02045 [Desulfovermiculus sp.]
MQETRGSIFSFASGKSEIFLGQSGQKREFAGLIHKPMLKIFSLFRIICKYCLVKASGFWGSAYHCQ